MEFKALQPGKSGVGRRRFLAAAAAAVGGFLAYRWWKRQPGLLIQRRHALITPNRDFYTVSIGAYPEKPDLQEWRLELAGPEGSFELSYQDLKALPSKTLQKTFMCISNPVGGDAVGNASWQVTPLEPLIRRILPARVAANQKVVFYALDGFYSSVPLQVALDPESYVAYEMNGVPLPREHGYPARVLLPGKYGMKQPRWLERVEVTEEEVSGYWEKRGWSDTCEIRMTARINRAEVLPDGSRRLLGVAYCGGTAVGGVELSDNGGQKWHSAELTSDSLHNAWSTWEWIWKPPGAGRHTVAVRTWDVQGRRQETDFSGPYPDGAAGLHRVIIEV